MKQGGESLLQGNMGLLVSVDANREILGHEAALHSLDANGLEVVCEDGKGLVVVQLGPVLQPARPGVDGGDRVGRGLLPLLVLAEVASDSAMGSLRLNSFAVWSDQHGGHQAEGAEALGHGVRLHVAVIVLASPNKATL